MMEIDYYDEIEKLRVLSNEGKITGDEFLDKFFLLRSCLIEEQFVYSGIIRNKINEGMKTLSERIKPEVKEIFEVESNRFPSILRGVIEELDSRYWVSDLTLGCVSTIASISGLQDYLKVKYQDMYMLENLNSMFEAHELIKEQIY